MKKEDEQRQNKINKIGARFEDQIADMITSMKPATEEVLVAAVAALASSLVEVTVLRFGKEKAPEMISLAVNSALKRATRQGKDKDKNE